MHRLGLRSQASRSRGGPPAVEQPSATVIGVSSADSDCRAWRTARANRLMRGGVRRPEPCGLASIRASDHYLSTSLASTEVVW